MIRSGFDGSYGVAKLLCLMGTIARLIGGCMAPIFNSRRLTKPRASLVVLFLTFLTPVIFQTQRQARPIPILGLPAYLRVLTWAIVVLHDVFFILPKRAQRGMREVAYVVSVKRRDRLEQTWRVRFCVFTAVGAIWISPALSAQERTVAITVDDLPYANGNLILNVPEARRRAEQLNRKLLAAFRSHHALVTGFVIEKTVESLGSQVGARILEKWIEAGFDLANHSYSHPDFNTLSTEQIEQEIVHGEATVRPLMEGSGKKVSFFRFPLNHTGDTKAKHDAVATFLAARGYKVATCTIDNSDYIFNQAYVRMLMKHDVANAAKLRDAYLAYTSMEIDYYSALDAQVFGYEPPQVMLMHDNQLNADVIEKVLELFENKHYRFVSLATAQEDAAYTTPDTYVSKFGPMWGYRWAEEKNVVVNGSLEAEPPQWIVEYGKTVGTPVP